MSKRRSLRKGITVPKADKVSKNLHLIAGKHEHNHKVTHSVAPISADEIEKLEAINPAYVDRLFNIMEKSITAEEKEVDRYFDAIANEQKNDELAIYAQREALTQSLRYSAVLLILLIIAGILFVYLGEPIIAGIIMSSVVGVVLKAILTRNPPQKPKDKK